MSAHRTAGFQAGLPNGPVETFCGTVALLAALASAFPAFAQTAAPVTDSPTKDDVRAGAVAPRTPAAGGTGGCLAPTPIITVDYIDTGDTTGAAGDVDVIPVTCNGYYTRVEGPERVYAFTVTAGNDLDFRLSTSSDAYDPSIYVLAVCGDGASCPFGAGADRCRARDEPQPAGCPILDSTETFSFSFVPGDYFLYVDSFYPTGNAEGRDAGPYTLEVTGSLPVELLEFTIE